MASRMAKYEMEALMAERKLAAEEGLPLHPSLEVVWHRLPGLREGLAQAHAVIELLQAHPELAPRVPPAGLLD
jgi:hypothetical protein